MWWHMTVDTGRNRLSRQYWTCLFAKVLFTGRGSFGGVVYSGRQWCLMVRDISAACMLSVVRLDCDVARTAG